MTNPSVLNAVIGPEHLYHSFTIFVNSRNSFWGEWGGTMSGSKRDVSFRVVCFSAEQGVLILA